MNKAPIVGQRSKRGNSQIWKVIHSQDCRTNHIEGLLALEVRSSYRVLLGLFYPLFPPAPERPKRGVRSVPRK